MFLFGFFSHLPLFALRVNLFFSLSILLRFHPLI